MNKLQEITVTSEQLRGEIRGIAKKLNISVDELYSRMDKREYRGTIMESKFHTARFLLGEI